MKTSECAGVVLQYCSGEKKCKIIECETFILEKDSAVEFELSGDVQFKDLAQHAGVCGKKRNTQVLQTRQTGGSKSWRKLEADMLLFYRILPFSRNTLETMLRLNLRVFCALIMTRNDTCSMRTNKRYVKHNEVILRISLG